MKRIIMLVAAVVMVSTAATAQKVRINSEKLLKNIAKSDEAIANPKKAANVNTWIDRGEYFYDVEVAVTKNLFVGNPETLVQTMLGRPTSRKSVEINGGNYNVMTYPPYVTAYFDASGNLFGWDTAPIYEGAADKAVEAYLKARELDTKNKKVKQIGEGLKLIFDELVKQATNDYSLGRNELAGGLFAKAFEIGQAAGEAYVNSTLVNEIAYNAGLTYIIAGDFTNSRRYFTTAIDAGYYDEGMTYAQNYRTYKIEYDAIEDDSIKRNNVMLEAKAMLEGGLAKFPSNEDIMTSLVQVYSDLGEDQSNIINVIKTAVEQEPNNIELWIALATIYQNTQEWNKAIEALTKVTEIDPSNSEMYYFIGAFHYNNALEVLAKVNSVVYGSQAEMDAAKKQYDDIYLQAIEALEKAYELNPNDAKTLDVLKRATFALREMPGMTEKNKQYSDALNALPQ